MGTHPIFESDFDCLTVKRSCGSKPFPVLWPCSAVSGVLCLQRDMDWTPERTRASGLVVECIPLSIGRTRVAKIHHLASTTDTSTRSRTTSTAGACKCPLERTIRSGSIPASCQRHSSGRPNKRPLPKPRAPKKQPPLYLIYFSMNIFEFEIYAPKIHKNFTPFVFYRK